MQPVKDDQGDDQDEADDEAETKATLNIQLYEAARIMADSIRMNSLMAEVR